MQLEKHLVLYHYFRDLFSKNSTTAQKVLKDINEGYDASGKSYFVDTLIGLKPEWEEKLLKYDQAIKDYISHISKHRNLPEFSLRYFQYLAVLYTEIFLDRYYSDVQNFLAELNAYVELFNNEHKSKINPFSEKDLRKLAFWMATGSGKTLILHINYLQILNYFKKWDNIILITPNEGLAKQHFHELQLSNIPAKLYDGNVDNLKTDDAQILVIDIHKLTKEKKGEGVSVDVSYFDGKNLLFIDEGHKGAGSTDENGWKNLRESMAKNGFMFEYSATFGQIIEFTKSGQPKGGKSNQTNIELYNEYTKSIIFNYSYKYFYNDGYGKDFHVYNIDSQDEYNERQRRLLLVADLLSYYEQLKLYQEHKEELKEYNIEKPLWIFVGSTVIKKKSKPTQDEKTTLSDVERVIDFLHSISIDETSLKNDIQTILDGKSGLLDVQGNDIFANHFLSLKKIDQNTLCDDIFKKVFHGRGKLELYDIANAEGEIALKFSTANHFFGVINVGDTTTLKKQLQAKGIDTKQEHFAQSLFFDINRPDSNLNVLIGAKKFIEGWNSWRVSNMCLLNIGKSEGPQIIQLFGRGVRLKGKNYSLKREENPNYPLKLLQTLYIFGLNANYIQTFLNTITKEEVKFEEISIPITFNNPKRWNNKLYIIETDSNFDFLQTKIDLEIDENILKQITLDLRPKIKLAHGLDTQTAQSRFDNPVSIEDDYFNILDWEQIYLDILEYKIARGMFNLSINKETLIKLAQLKKYTIYLPPQNGIEIDKNGYLKLTSFQGIFKLQEFITQILKSYIDKFYKNREKAQMMHYLQAKPLQSNHPSIFPEEHTILLKFPQEFLQDLNEIQKQLQNYDPQVPTIPQDWNNWDESFVIHFDNHLYTPLIIWMQGKDAIKSYPVKLNEGETQFVRDLKNFIDNLEKQDIEIYLLRNLAKKGVGFFFGSGFYPDFILWVVNENKQHIIFIDPKGIRNLGNFNDDKIQFCSTYIKEVNNQIQEKNSNISLDAFILSTTTYDEIKKTFGDGNHTKKDFHDHHIYFLEEKYLDMILNFIIN